MFSLAKIISNIIYKLKKSIILLPPTARRKRMVMCLSGYICIFVPLMHTRDQIREPIFKILSIIDDSKEIQYIDTIERHYGKKMKSRLCSVGYR